MSSEGAAFCGSVRRFACSNDRRGKRRTKPQTDTQRVGRNMWIYQKENLIILLTYNTGLILCLMATCAASCVKVTHSACPNCSPRRLHKEVLWYCGKITWQLPFNTERQQSLKAWPQSTTLLFVWRSYPKNLVSWTSRKHRKSSLPLTFTKLRSVSDKYVFMPTAAVMCLEKWYLKNLLTSLLQIYKKRSLGLQVNQIMLFTEVTASVCYISSEVNGIINLCSHLSWLVSNFTCIYLHKQCREHVYMVNILAEPGSL